MKEQLERMFPGAVVTEGDSFVSVRCGDVAMNFVKPKGNRGRFSGAVGADDKDVAIGLFADSLHVLLSCLRESVKNETVMAPTKTARARAARVLRVLDAAKLDEVNR